jgi:hypothetical protein
MAVNRYRTIYYFLLPFIAAKQPFAGFILTMGTIRVLVYPIELFFDFVSLSLKIIHTFSNSELPHGRRLIFGGDSFTFMANDWQRNPYWMAAVRL